MKVIRKNENKIMVNILPRQIMPQK